MTYPQVDLGSVVDLQAGIGFPTRLQGKTSGKFPFAKVGDISRNGRTGKPILSTVDNYIDQTDVESLRAKIIPEGSILFAKIGEAIKQNHRVISHRSLLIDNNAMAAIPSEKIDNLYLYYFLKQVDFYRLAPATTVPALRKSDLEKIKIPLPPLSEQRRIASILDQADVLRQKRQQAIEKLDQLLQATFIDMFGDPVSNPKGWDKLTIEKMLNNEKYSLKRGPFGGALKKEIFVESGYLVYEQYHALNNDFSFQRYFIDEDKYKELKAFNVKPKDIIVSCSGVNLGRLAEVPEGSPAGIINQALLKISLNQSIILNDIFIDIFMHPSFKKAFYGDFRGAAIPNFPPMSVFKEFEFIVPPLEIQKKYQSVKSQVKALQKNHQLADEMNLFSSLQNQAFNGTL